MAQQLPVNEIERVADLLFGAEGENPEPAENQAAAAPLPAEKPDPAQGGDETGSSDEPPRAEMPGTVKALAEKLGVTPQQLYDSLEIPIANRETGIKLGEFKDRAQELLRADEVRAQAEDARAELQQQRVQFQQQVNALVSAVGPDGKFDRQRFQQALDYVGQTKAQQEAIILAAAPELKQQEAQQRLVDTLARYGIPQQTVDASIGAGWLLMAHRLAELEARIQKAGASQAKPDARPPQAPQKQSAAQRQAQIVSQAKAGQLGQVEAVSQLLFGS